MPDYIFQLLPLLIWGLVSVPPSIRLLQRSGRTAYLAAVNVIPLGGAVIVLWICAYSRQREPT